MAVLLLSVSSAVTMSVPFSMGRIIDIVSSPNPELPYHLTYSLLFASLSGLFLLGATANGFRVYLMRVTGERIIARLRRRLYGKLVKEDISFFDRQGSGELTSSMACVRSDGTTCKLRY